MSAERFREPKNEVEERSLLAEVTPNSYSVQYEVGKERFRGLAAKQKLQEPTGPEEMSSYILNF